MPIRQITIIGTGLIGGSFGLALKKRGFAGRIVGCDRAPVLKRAREKGAIDDARTDLAESVRGSQVVLQGPAALEVLSSDAARLESGSLTAHVPHTGAKLRIAVPGADVIDLGTEFAVSVDRDQAAEAFAHAVDR